MIDDSSKKGLNLGQMTMDGGNQFSLDGEMVWCGVIK